MRATVKDGVGGFVSFRSVPTFSRVASLLLPADKRIAILLWLCRSPSASSILARIKEFLLAHIGQFNFFVCVCYFACCYVSLRISCVLVKMGRG